MTAPTTLTFAEALARVDAATTPAQLFTGPDPAAEYRRLAKALHPDVAPASANGRATAAFARLATLWAEHTGRAGGVVLTSRRHRYVLGRRLARGDLANLYTVEYDGGTALLKLPRRPAYNDFVEREAAALTTLARDGDPRHHVYVPRLVDHFRHEDPATGVRRGVNVLEHHAGLVTLAEVADAYPDGLDPRDAAWMWRRLLVALGYAHGAGLVHGAVLPEHVLIHPAQHGLVLVDWCYSVPVGTPLPAMVGRHRDRYPPEVAARRPATAATDIYLASDLMRRLMGARAHPALTRFITGCTLERPRMRPQDAWRLLAEFDELLGDLYGPRRFRPFTMPGHPAGH